MEASVEFTLDRPRAASITPEGRKLAQDKIDTHVAKLNRGGTPATGSSNSTATLSELLFDARASFKVFTSLVAMHLDDRWRMKLFRSLDSLLDPSEWDEEDPPPVLGAFKTLMRLLLILRPSRGPALGIDGKGNLIASWTSGEDRLTVTCYPNDNVVWVLRRSMGGETARSAGQNRIGLMPSVLAPYAPQVWFDHAK